MSSYDLIIKNTRVFDPVNQRDVIADIAIAEGKIVAIEPEISSYEGTDCYSLEGAIAIPGIIDLHAHSGSIWGSPYAQAMLAKAGVCTSLDMAGPLDNVLNLQENYGAGLNIAILQYASPPYTLESANPSHQALATLVRDSLNHGAYGVKLLGGHYPLTPEASALLIEEIARQGGYVAWHAGTTNKGSNIEGMREAIACADGNFLHLAHINSYCRGAIRPEIDEMQEAIELLIAHPNIYSESYLSPLNGTSLSCQEGVPVSLVTQNSLKKLGLPATEAGIELGLAANRLFCIVNVDGESRRYSGEKGVIAWREHDTRLSGMFPVNPPVPRYGLAVAKRETGDFVVDCISTDGGCIPRNVIIEMGLALVELQALTLAEFVYKTSWNPSRVLRLANKGSLGIGMDADITVIDPIKRSAVATIVNGKVAMLQGEIKGHGAQIICTERGAKAISARGLTPYLADPSQSPLAMSETR